MRLVFRFLYFSLGVGCRLQLLDGLAQALSRRSKHFGLQLIKGNSQVMGNVDRGHELSEVFEALRGSLQVCSRRQQALQLAGELGIGRQLLRDRAVAVMAGEVIV